MKQRGAASPLQALPPDVDPEMVAQIAHEAWPEPRDADEMHDALLQGGYVAAAEARHHGWGPWLETLAQANRAGRLRPSLAAPPVWVAGERWAEALRAWPAAHAEFAPTLPPSLLATDLDEERALREMVRGRLEILGPVPQGRILADMPMAAEALNHALLRLENEGFAFRGGYWPGEPLPQWCERRLLARLQYRHRDRHRSSVEPVPVAAYCRFLQVWQGLGEQAGEGLAAVEARLDQFEGFEAPLEAWERAILPARIRRFDPALLDWLCLSGKFVALRLRPPPADLEAKPRRPGSLRSVPLAFVRRENLARWLAMRPESEPRVLSGSAQEVLEAMRARGPAFSQDLATVLRQPASFVEQGLASLFAQGLITCDGVSGLKSLLPRSHAKPTPRFRGGFRPPLPAPAAAAGRWAELPAEAPLDALAREDWVQSWCRLLARRTGVVCRKLAEREALAPPWRECVRALRLLEDRGELRGGRFLEGVWGEQFAHPEAVALLEKARPEKASAAVSNPDSGDPDDFYVLSVADPANMQGILTPGPKSPLHRKNRIAWRQGRPLAAWEGGKMRRLAEIPDADFPKLARLLEKGENFVSKLAPPGN